MSTLSDILNDVATPVKTVADVYVSYLNNKAALGLAQSQSTIEELKASTSLLQQQNEAQRLAQQSAQQSGAAGLNVKNLGAWLIGGALVFAAYKLLK